MSTRTKATEPTPEERLADLDSRADALLNPPAEEAPTEETTEETEGKTE